jgi:alpha-beta hydrolase superfamily lysophospholipase
MTEQDSLHGDPGKDAVADGVQRCRTTDGLDLHCRYLSSPDPRGVIVIVHGLGEHSGRYLRTVEHFASEGWAVVTGDLRGHGRSPDAPGGGRVFVRRFTDYFLDVDALVAAARQRHPALPLFLLGHSMGGLITIGYVLRDSAGLAGAVISSPALDTHPEFRPPLVLRLLVGLLSRLAPAKLFPSDLDTEALSRDPDVVRAYVEDPLVSRAVSARWYAEAMKTMKGVRAQAGALRLPMLLMQSGADRLVDPDAPARWAASAPPGLVEQVTWEGFYHEMFNEPGKDAVRARTLAWLQGQLADGPEGVAAPTPAQAPANPQAE